jgi:enoyl-CoA hydratase
MSAATGTDPVTVPILTGTGTVFTAGADLREAAAPGDAQSLATELAAVVSAIEDLRCPVVAAVNGAAAGGGLEVALACDLRIASADAVFVAAGVNVGLIASFWRLPRVIGLGPAKQMLLTGRPCDAETALRWGLVGEGPPTARPPLAQPDRRRADRRPPPTLCRGDKGMHSRGPWRRPSRGRPAGGRGHHPPLRDGGAR